MGFENWREENFFPFPRHPVLLIWGGFNRGGDFSPDEKSFRKNEKKYLTK
jgi:UDP-N-acetylmuramoylalanine-D-glutamate ligase